MNLFNIFSYFTNIKIIFVEKTVTNLLYIAIIKNIESDNFICYSFSNILTNNLIIKYFYYILGFFCKISFIYIDNIPDNFIDIINFYKNDMIYFEIYDNNNQYKILIDELNNDKIIYNNNLLNKYKDNLFLEQINFFEMLKNSTNQVNNYIINLYNKSLDIFISVIWELSFEGNLIIEM